MFKSLGNMAAMLRQAQQLGGRMQALTEQLGQHRVTGSAASGLVQVEMNGLGEMLSLRIAPTLDDRIALENLVPLAVNEASARAKELHAELLQSLTNSLDLPGMNDMLSKLTNPTG